MTGSQGIQGPRGFNGTDGVNGTQGPAGPHQINSTSIYTVIGNEDDSTLGDGFATSVAMCNPGDTVLSGSYTVVQGGLARIITDTALIAQDGWQTVAFGTTTDFVAVRTYAQCFDNP